MKKLTPAEIRFLDAIPPDHIVECLNRRIPGTLRQYEWPKGTNRRTVEGLWKKGLIGLGFCMVSELPCSLTGAGKRALAESGPSLDGLVDEAERKARAAIDERAKEASDE